jgi:DNA polymerase-3 subunit delta'
VDRVSDVFDHLVGQEHAATALRQYAVAPVHAYLFTGPLGTSVHDALVCFAAALQCHEHGCGECATCRRVLREQDADVHLAERSGLTWRVDELRELERVARRRPLGDGYQIIIIEDVELTVSGPSPSAAALLKSLEEPPGRTIYLLGASEVPAALATIASRCVEVKLRALGTHDLATILAREGVEAGLAASAAAAAGGNLRRARVLARDPALGSRVAAWRAIPERLKGTPASSSEVAREVASSLDDAVAPLSALQDDEWTRRVDEAREFGQRTVGSRREMDTRFKREQRRFRVDETRFGLSALTDVYRARLLESLEAERDGDVRARTRVAGALGALDALAEANARLASNLDESLLLHDLMLRLAEL